MRPTDPASPRQRGQILILFALAIFVIVGVVGVVLDGGAAYAQRRAEQGVADLAAMAGGREGEDTGAVCAVLEAMAGIELGRASCRERVSECV